ncbi:MAG: LysR family transcriptional regulator [Magnetospirillum sp.]|nr:LysR family transcriptional regulator [Magnetospirillum sp.]
MVDRKRTGSPDWEDLRHFLALARFGTLSAAARALGVNHATVSRRVAALEAVLGRVLFDRRADGYALTADGQAILAEAEPMEAAALAVACRLDRGGQLAGPVRLTATRIFADAFLAAHLGQLARRHPAIDLELVTGSRPFSLARREADLALRLGRPRDSDLRGRQVATVGHAFYAGEEWRMRLAAGEAPRLIGFDAASRHVPEAAWLERFAAGRPMALRSDSWAIQAAAAAAGAGVALLPHYLAALHPVLAPVSLGAEPPSAELWLLVRPDLGAVPRVRAVADFLAELCRRHAGLLCAAEREG